MAKLTLLADTFIGEEVEILLDLNHKSVEETSEGSLIQESPLSTRGFLLDLDDDFLYLGSTADEITKAIHRNYVVGIEVLQVRTEFDYLLDKVPTEGQGN